MKIKLNKIFYHIYNDIFITCSLDRHTEVGVYRGTIRTSVNLYDTS